MDILRLAVAFSDGDVSLATNTKFRKFKRAERRLLLELLEQCGNKVEDMLRYKNRWIRLGEILHPAEYETYFSAVKKLLISSAIINLMKHSAGKSNCAPPEDTSLAVDILISRAGEFARRLDHLLRMEESSSQVVDKFAEIAARFRLRCCCKL